MTLLKKIDSCVPVILCGGSGTRLWPVSRRDYPKQFNHLIGDKSLFQDTILRLNQVFTHKPLIVTSNSMKFLALHELETLGIDADIIAEPVARNSGPAVLLAAYYVKKHYTDCHAAVFASDHVISGIEGFHQSIQNAVTASQKDYIVTFGVTPTAPSVAYGYIASGDKIEGTSAHHIQQFAEKPNIETAKDYIQKNYVWNSGNFLFKPDILIGEYQSFDTVTTDIVCKSLENAKNDLNIIIPSDDYAGSNPLSVDYAVMEKTKKSAVVTADFAWSDAGTWQSLYELSSKDSDGNASYGDKIVMQDSKNSFVHNHSEKLICLSNLDDVSVVVTDDVVFVAPKDNADYIKKMLATLTEHKRPEVTTPKSVHRPWGYYETITLGDRFQVKKITVYAGAALSLQKHFHRAEHWVVVSGTAEVTNGDNVILLSENQSTYIPLGQVHRLKNAGRIPLELIEVQSGSYLGEDDIVRFDDVYNRV